MLKLLSQKSVAVNRNVLFSVHQLGFESYKVSPFTVSLAFIHACYYYNRIKFVF